MTAPLFDPAAFGGDPEAPPVPMVISWDDLDASAYRDTVDGLSRWLVWFRRTYRIPSTVFPPCWYTHPGIREDLGHLWTGWLITRHADAGVGMIGMDWDARREQAITRLREATAITGCTGTQHRDEPPMPAEPDIRLWDEHLTQEVRARFREALRHSAIQAVTELLQQAELRHDLAGQALADIATQPEAATDQDRASAAAELHRLAAAAPGESTTAAQDAIRTMTDIQHTADREASLAMVRQALATSIAATALDGPDRGPTGPDATRRWLDALETLVPASLAADRAAAIASARSAAVARRVAAHHRHPDVEHLLAARENPDWEGDPE